MKHTATRIAALIAVLALLVSCIPTIAFASGTKTFVTTASCNLRSEPNKNSKSLDKLSKGVTFKATDFEEDSRGVTWYFGSYKNKTGWISSKNLKEKSSSGKNTPKPTKKPSKEPTYKKYAVITGSCNIRKSPSLDGKKIGTADKGDYFKCSGAAYDDRGVVWYKIKYNGSTAWVSSKYSKAASKAPSEKTAEPAATATPKPIDYSSFVSAEYYVKVTASTLNMRFEPSGTSSIVGCYKNGDILYAMRTNGAWVQVLDEETNRSGYMAAMYLEEYSFEAAATEDPEVDETIASTVENIEELQSATPKAVLIDAPEGSTNVVYSWEYINTNDVTVAQIAFSYEGVDYVLYAAFCPSEADMLDIDHIETEPSVESADQHIEMSTDGTQAVVHYYDDANSTQYALVGPAASNGALVYDMATRLFTVEDANIPDLVFTSAEEEAAAEESAEETTEETAA